MRLGVNSEQFMSNPKAVICPYCGEAQPTADQCRACGGLFEPLSRQATHNAMGPWFLRDIRRPFQPGCSYETLVKMIERGQVTKLSIIRGPTTRQFWTLARRVPGVAHLLGYCHACDASVDAPEGSSNAIEGVWGAAHGCHACGVPFGAYLDRNFMGLPEVRPLPWEPGFDGREPSPISESDLGWRPPASAATPGALGAMHSRGHISSFASDAEIRANRSRSNGPESADYGTQSIATQPKPESAATVADQRAIVPGRHESGSVRTAAADVTSPVMRALQRRIEAQRRTVRVLIIFTATLTILLLISYLPQLASRLKSDQRQDAAPPGHRGSPSGQVETMDAPSGDPQPKSDSQKSSESQEQIETEPVPIRPLEPAPTPGAQQQPEATAARESDADSVASPYDAEFDRAKLLLELAESADFSLEDRIKACEEAVLVLENIMANKPAQQIPHDLKSILERARTELERLKLKKHFP